MMNQLSAKKKRVFAWICAALMLALLALQFMPFWHYGEEGELSASISAYIWFPNDHKDLTTYLTEAVSEDYAIEQILLMPIVTLILGACGIVFCLIKADHPVTLLFPAACGLVGVWGYLAKPAFRLGANWGVHLAVCLAMLTVAVCALVLSNRRKAN